MSERYFAYGSNLWLDQMVERTGPLGEGAERPQVAWLAGYRLVFNVRGDSDREVFANIMRPGQGVFGVVYWCSRQALKKMDVYEKGYERSRVRVVLDNGAELDTITYFAKPARIGPARQPTDEYLARIQIGARQHGLPAGYLREIEAAARADPGN